MVCEKKKYFLFGISHSTGTSFTPKSTSQSETSSVTSSPSDLYSSSVNTLISELSTFSCASGCSLSNLDASSGVNTTLLSGGFFLSLIIPNFILVFKKVKGGL
ncbi:hypothetical protein D3C86_1347510 [compost metagenome]